MPRCQCGAGTCACQIDAASSSGVTISGAGVEGNPWVFNVTAQDNSIVSKIRFDDTPSMDFHSVGLGTNQDALVVTADSHPALTELRDLLVGDTPATGEVPMWQTDHWEWKALPSGPPTTVQTANGISGDGSAGTPVSFRNSATWDSFWQGVFGTTNTNQDVTYIDSNGQVRVPGTLIDAGTVGRLAADMMDKYPNGVSLLALSQAAAAAGGWPGAGSVLTTKRNSTQGTQFWMNLSTVASGLPPWIQYRYNDGVGWSAWVDIHRDTGWVSLTPTSGSGNFAYRNYNGVVGVHASLSGLTSVPINTNSAMSAAGAIPAALRPTVPVYQISNGGAQINSVTAQVAPDGTIWMMNGSTVPQTVFRCNFTYLPG